MNSPLETHIQNQVLIRPTKFSDDLKHNNKTFQHRADYYEMIKYINTFLDEDTNNRYFLLPGIRGVGKTTILIQLYGRMIMRDWKNYMMKQYHKVYNRR